MNLIQNKCPNCDALFNLKTFYNSKQIVINLDKQYDFIFMDINCSYCNKNIQSIYKDIPIFWIKDDQFTYNRFVKNKSKLFQSKKYLYFYFPINDKKIIKNIFSLIKKNYDVLIIPENFVNYIQWDKQLCILPIQIFECNMNTLYPNYLAQKIIVNEVNKYKNSILDSIYNTFLNNFSLIYKIQNWQKLKLKLN